MGGAALSLYLLTLAPGTLYGDPAKFQTMAWNRELAFNEAGHALWVLLMHPVARLPGANVAFACNLASAVLTALSLWPAWRIARRLGASREASAVACLALAVSHTTWLHAVVTEVYALNSFAALWLLDAATAAAMGSGGPRTVAAWGVSGLAAGLCAGNHGLVLLWLPGLGWLVVEGVRRGQVRLAGLAAAVGGVVVGLGVFAALRVLATQGANPVAVALKLARATVQPDGLARDLAVAAGFLLYQFPIPVIPIAALLGAWSTPARVRRPLLLLIACSMVFAVRYPVKDRFAFFQPAYLVVALLAAPGLDLIRSRLAEWIPAGRRFMAPVLVIACVAAPPLVYAGAVPLAKRGLFPLRSGARDLPGRDELAYYLYPGKRGDDGPDRHARAMLEALGPAAVVLADHSLRTPMEYLRDVEGLRPDVEFIWAPAVRQVRLMEQRAAEGRPLYLAATDRLYDVTGLSSRFDIIQDGPAHRLVPRGGMAAGQSGSS